MRGGLPFFAPSHAHAALWALASGLPMLVLLFPPFGSVSAFFGGLGQALAETDGEFLDGVPVGRHSRSVQPLKVGLGALRSPLAELGGQLGCAPEKEEVSRSDTKRAGFPLIEGDEESGRGEALTDVLSSAALGVATAAAIFGGSLTARSFIRLSSRQKVFPAFPVLSKRGADDLDAEKRRKTS